MLRNDAAIEPAEQSSFRETFKGKLNVEARQAYAQIRRNIRRPLPQVDWYAPNDYKIALLCGGPSLAQAKIPRGYKIATVNGAHQWALDHGMRPSMHCMHDAREFNARFIANPVLTCKYLICSQAHPSVFDALEGMDVSIWHATSGPEKKIIDRYYMGRYRHVIGGSTIGSRAISLLYMSGVRTIRVYGMDCCYSRKAHHAYSQPENDARYAMRMRVGRRRFTCDPWMAAQLDEMIQMLPGLPADLNLSIEGDGMLAYVIAQTSKRGHAPRITVEAK